MLDGLERTDRATELHTILGVLDRHLEDELSATDLLGGEGNGGEIEDGDSDLLGNEPAYGSDGAVMGIGTSGAFGHAVGKSLAFVYVDPEYEAAGSTFEIEMLGVRRRATVLDEPAYDPASKALRS